MAETPLVFEIATFAVLAVFFVVDLFIIGRKPHVPSTKECVQHIAFFVVMALIFGGLMWFFAGSKPAIEFYSGWLTEYSLSIDNLFVFVIIMSNFAVPKELQKFVLSVGITVALVLRGMFILVGAAIISRFTWVFFLFGAFLIVTAIKLVAGGDEDEEYHENALIHALRKVIKITDEYDGEKLRFLIDSLVKLSRLENGIISLSPQQATLQPLLESVVEQYTAKASEKGLSLQMQDTDAFAVFDFKWTAEALANIVDNAIKYTEHGTITISAVSYEMFARIDISDTGSGIPESEQAKIFARFYRSNSVQKQEGVGIGLYLARQIISGEGGYIKVASVPGKGSTFSIFLPK